jgi:hypothetical protein
MAHGYLGSAPGPLHSAPGPSALYGLGEMSGAATAGIMVGILAVLGVGGYFVYKLLKKDDAASTTTPAAGT